MKTLEPIPLTTWICQAKCHDQLIAPYAEAFIKRREHGLKHPVHDFLFTYYSLSPSKLRQWVPSFDKCLEMTLEAREERPWLNDYWFSFEDGYLISNKEKVQENHLSLAQFIMKLSNNILNRPPRFGCYGLHEWAMVYKTPSKSVRHNSYPLRLSEEKLSSFVESQKIYCTHYDAYRFFTKEARPLNMVTPTLETRLEMEQAGCVHANMDLYKWAIKLWPWIGSELLAKTFFLAMQARELDMRASPYDLTQDGYSPICIETEEGRKHYQKEQQLLTEQATYLRKELIAFCEQFHTAYTLSPSLGPT